MRDGQAGRGGSDSWGQTFAQKPEVGKTKGGEGVTKFIAGILVMSASTSLHQDLMGKTRYLAMVEAGWVDWRVTVPIAVLALIAAWLLYHAKEGRKG